MKNVEINLEKEDQTINEDSSVELSIDEVGNDVFNTLYEKSGMISLIRLRDRMNEYYETENYAAIYQMFADTCKKTICDKPADKNGNSIFQQLKNVIKNTSCVRTLAEDVFTGIQDYIENVDKEANYQCVAL